jgi:hypothetical protein
VRRLVSGAEAVVYERRRPEGTTLYQVVLDNLETLYGAVDDGAVKVALPGFVKKELEGYLDCGLLCRGFARLQCGGCEETRLVAFSCKGRGFCPSCLGRKMSATAANLMEHVLPEGVPLRQWVLTFPFPWRKRLGYDGALLGALVRKFTDAVLAFYARRLKEHSGALGQSGAVIAVQRTSSDLRLNPHVHAVFLDGAYEDLGDRVLFRPLPTLSTRDVADVLEQAKTRMTKYLRRRGLLDDNDDSGQVLAEDAEDDGSEASGLSHLAAAAADGRTPPAGPAWRRGALPVVTGANDFERHLSVGSGGFTLHAATRAGGMDERGREALLKYVLRPPIAQERITHGPDGLVRIALKKSFSDGTVAVDLDPLSLLTRLCASVPPPRRHTVRYAGVLGAASKVRSRIVPRRPPAGRSDDAEPASESERGPHRRGCRYWSWSQLLRRTFSIDVLSCPRCGGRLRLVAMMTEPKEIARYLRALAEPTEAPARTPARGPPYWRSRVLRRQAGVDDAA